MKKLFLILFIIPVLCFSQGVHQDFKVLNPEGGTTLSILGTGSDTTAAFRLFEISTLYTIGSPTAAEDSVSYSLKLQVNPDTALVDTCWVDVKTLAAVTDSSVWVYRIITNTPIPSGQFGRYIGTGSAVNDKEEPVEVEIIHDNYESTRRR